MGERRSVAVVGGGIAGVTLAAALDPARFAVTVYEAQPERVGGGAALGVWPSARRVLAALGAWPALAERAAPIGLGSLHDLTGRVLLQAHTPPLLMVERPALLATLSAVVPGSVRRVDERVDDATALDADLVVGADGVRSVVRGLVEPGAAERVATPYVALRGLRAAPAGVSYGEYWGPGRLFGMTPVAPAEPPAAPGTRPGTGTGERAYWFSTHVDRSLTEPLDVAEVLAQARERFAGAAPLVREVLADPGDDILANRLWLAPPLTRYARGRYVVLGDAAHAGLPNLGRGACDALLDAAALARTLNRAPARSLAGALAAWQARRLPPTQVARATASLAMRTALADRGHGARNRALALLGRATGVAGGRPGERTGPLA